MAIIEILQYPDPRLAQKADRVTVFDDDLQRIIDDMLETLYHTENCGGLAATQLNIKDPPNITVIYDYRKGDSPYQEEALVLVNPQIIAREGKLYEPEGCMSISATYVPVVRSAKVRASALDRTGQPFDIEGEGYMSKLLQHEIDHLNGVIFIDHLSRLARERVNKKIAKMKKWAEK